MAHPALSNQRFIILSFLALSFLVVLSGCSGINEPTQSPNANETAFFEQEVSASGEAVPIRWTTLTYPNGASNLELLVKEGDQVAVNALLVKNNDSRLDAALEQAEAALKRAEFAYEQTVNAPSEAAIKAADAAYLNALANLIRQEDLNADEEVIEAAQADVDAAYANLLATLDGASVQEISAAESDLQAAEFNLDQAQSAFYLKAPFEGTVVEVNIKAGEGTSPLQPVLTIADLSEFQVVTTDLSEVDVARLKEGQIADIVFDAIPDRTFKGTIERIADKSSGVSSVYYDVTLLLDEIPEELRWGMTAFIIFPIE
jgi:multidrug efflux pump subunit AcrA (membrane-fusion protein)